MKVNLKAVLIVFGVAAVSCAAGLAMEIPRDSLFFFIGGTLLLSALFTLAFDRLVLVRFEHLLLRTDASLKAPLHARLHAKIHGLDRWGLFLGVGLILYACIFAIYLVIRLYQAIVHDFVKLIPHA